MTVFYSIDEALNRIRFPEKSKLTIVRGLKEFCDFIALLAESQIKTRNKPIILCFDGYLGVKWNQIISTLQKTLEKRNLNFSIIDFSTCYKSPSEIESIIRPYLEKDPNFGFVFKGRINNFLDFKNVEKLKEKIKIHEENGSAVICYGPGSSIPYLRKIYDKIFYFDITRERIFNDLENNPVPLGWREKIAFKEFVRRFYYVDSQVLDRHKKYILNFMDYYVESNNPSELKFLPRKVYFEILSELAEYPFAIKPLYYPVTWGGNYLKRMKKLPESMVNSGQGFIVPVDNSVRIAVDNVELEIPFLNLLWAEAKKILGDYAFRKFKGHFPIVYWYDDSIEGWHMAIQVHANRTYMKKHFNEPFSQDESYYIVFTGPGAKTYLGLKDDANIEDLRRDAKRAEKEHIPFDHEKYINSIPTKPGDYFLIPNGTVHASGRNQVVLEINGEICSYGPGYTFHIYDYLKPDLDGTLRPIHIEHSFSVIKSSRRAKWVMKNLKQQPRLIRLTNNGAEYLLGSYKNMYYEVHRIEVSSRMDDDTKGKFHGLTLVDGEKVIISSKKDPEKKYELNFLDTIIIPASIGEYEIINLGPKPAKIVKALVK
jgi:mannose-6-phosphate isomerase class I